MGWLGVMNKDQLFARPRKALADFTFNQAVVDVFPDMIRRSVPGYEQIISMLGVFSRHYIKDNSYVYDLGCSLGAATLSIYQQQLVDTVYYIAVDNSSSMLEQCRLNLNQYMPNANIDYRCEDIQQTDIQQASLILLNFTLQFLPADSRSSLIQHLYNGLNTGGALILSENNKF